MDRYQSEREAKAARDLAQKSLDSFYNANAGVIETYHSLVNNVCVATRAHNDELRKSYTVEIKSSEPEYNHRTNIK